MYDVLCTGLTCCDLIFAKLEKFPELGKEMVCEDFMIKPGGAANTPVALTRLGMKTAYVTTIGGDTAGNIIYEYLKKTGLDMSSIIYDESQRTNVSAVLSIGKERGFATYFAKANEEMELKRIQEIAPRCRHLHTYIHDCLNMPMLEIAKKNNMTLSVDTAWDESIKLKDIKHIIENADVFMTNEVEACCLTETDDAEKALSLLGEHAKILVIKLGGKGSIVKRGDKIIRVPAAEVGEALDTTGAGDLYGAGFVYGYLKGWDLEETARFASASGSLAVTFYGGMDERYTLERVTELYESIR
ncbi:hypothetical protein CDQ84_02795 [Clostridium thermosuccinogenes]|jgi:sugar/nucleoside kinase (ribokinase family)|uniref:Carbohydrate kinase PfkB domain-containing protein n=1 Tax=Clostridium thermosuccinogenes TaxID=84032 RepID=A0A2K2FQL2_9CLOT|nr:PfkB family carbohydrate kinase [Pseudoclostridium thermosuccinogenes]AUS95997.1 hypothetical protein CDO33_05820 [Pseudoclostridium thermosuccinogenes]PNT93280.1 hypothetical protein CDQ83_07110 [Pseudoclostridium thermosuccinogenes]PNT99386.1 hypothetical protein CDQ85_02795 [Pseudoclostridium thermosuccinogenes]PNU01073.1 hypothetical protein CDQ84_02795 [Pseudoclostridium thermosuccinogenes]